jgi:hypothetical protein
VVTGRRVEHGSPEGYARGCTVHEECPALPVHGLTCATAHIRFESGERRYMKLYGQQLTAAAIADRLGIRPPRSRPNPPVDVVAPGGVTTGPTIAVIGDNAGGEIVQPLEVYVAPALEPAQPLAERAQDSAPQEDAGVPVVEEEAPVDEPVAEDEAMGHPTTREEEIMPEPEIPPTAERPEPLRTDKYTTGMTLAGRKAKLAEIREWCRAAGFTVPSTGRIPQDALAAYDANLASLERHARPAEPPVEEVAAPGVAALAVEAATSAEYSEAMEQARGRAGALDPDADLVDVRRRPEYSPVDYEELGRALELQQAEEVHAAFDEPKGEIPVPLELALLEQAALERDEARRGEEFLLREMDRRDRAHREERSRLQTRILGQQADIVTLEFHLAAMRMELALQRTSEAASAAAAEVGVCAAAARRPWWRRVVG